MLIRELLQLTAAETFADDGSEVGVAILPVTVDNQPVDLGVGHLAVLGGLCIKHGGIRGLAQTGGDEDVRFAGTTDVLRLESQGGKGLRQSQLEVLRRA